MKKEKYLDEEKYKKNEKKLVLVAVILLLIGLSIGGFLIYKGITFLSKDANKSTIDSLNKELLIEKTNLENKKAELKAKGVTYETTPDYDEGEKYDLYIISSVLDPAVNYCSFDEYLNNEITKNYCSLKKEIDLEKDDNHRKFEGSKFLMIGGFLTFFSLIIFINLIITAKKRYISAFVAQQKMPIIQEGIEEMTPTLGKSSHEVAKEISEGVTEGINDVKNKEKNE